jgi:hypothetical protein
LGDTGPTGGGSTGPVGPTGSGGFAVGAQVFKTGAFAVTGGAAVAAIPFDTTVWDPNNYHVGGQPTRITPSVAGKYEVLGQVAWAANVSAFRHANIRKSGSLVKGTNTVQTVTDPGIPTAHEVNAVVDMNGTTDYVELMVNAGFAAGATSVLGGSVFNAGLTLQRIA